VSSARNSEVYPQSTLVGPVRILGPISSVKISQAKRINAHLTAWNSIEVDDKLFLNCGMSRLERTWIRVIML
jgi:hypothetical protein